MSKEQRKQFFTIINYLQHWQNDILLNYDSLKNDWTEDIMDNIKPRICPHASGWLCLLNVLQLNTKVDRNLYCNTLAF